MIKAVLKYDFTFWLSFYVIYFRYFINIVNALSSIKKKGSCKYFKLNKILKNPSIPYRATVRITKKGEPHIDGFEVL